MAWVRTGSPAEADGAVQLHVAGGRRFGVEMEDYVLAAEERDRAVVDTGTRGKRNRP